MTVTDHADDPPGARPVPNAPDDPPRPADELAPRRAARKAAGQVPPHDLDAERALLGAAMIDEAAATVAASLPTDNYYSTGHGHVAHAIAILDADGLPTDPVAVADRLAADGLLDDAGGRPALVEIMAAAGPSSSAPHYARIIAGHARLRRILAAAHDAAQAAYARNLAGALGPLEAVLDDTPTDDAVTTIGDLLGPQIDLLEARQEGDTNTVPTGLVALDDVLTGLHPGELHVLAARPAMGKTTLGGQLALNIAADATPVLFVSLEMSRVELADRWLGNLGHVDTIRMQRGTMTDADWRRIGTATGRLVDLPLTVLDDPVVTVPQIRALARATGAQVVIVDYLQLVTPTRRTSNRQEEVAEVARGLKVLARVLDVPVVALAQLNRNLEARIDKRPTLSDLRDSGEIEAAAGIVVGLYRPHVYDETADRRALELIVLKNRHGATSTAHVEFEAYRQAVTDHPHPHAQESTPDV